MTDLSFKFGKDLNAVPSNVSHCPDSLASWYCLNGATCFSVIVDDSILYNCWCQSGFHGARCDYKYSTSAESNSIKLAAATKIPNNEFVGHQEEHYQHQNQTRGRTNSTFYSEHGEHQKIGYIAALGLSNSQESFQPQFKRRGGIPTKDLSSQQQQQQVALLLIYCFCLLLVILLCLVIIQKFYRKHSADRNQTVQATPLNMTNPTPPQPEEVRVQRGEGNRDRMLNRFDPPNDPKRLTPISQAPSSLEIQATCFGDAGGENRAREQEGIEWIMRDALCHDFGRHASENSRRALSYHDQLLWERRPIELWEPSDQHLHFLQMRDLPPDKREETKAAGAQIKQDQGSQLEQQQQQQTLPLVAAAGGGGCIKRPSDMQQRENSLLLPFSVEAHPATLTAISTAVRI